jgi:hypothetical protein
MDLASWRHLWRARGLALDRLLAITFATPAPPLGDLKSKVERSVLVPGTGRRTLTESDVALVVDAAVFVAGYVAEYLPMQVTVTDSRACTPCAPTALAVRGAKGEPEFAGSFDFLLRVYAQEALYWKPYDGSEIALDVKLSGCSTVLGLNGATMRANFAHARAVMMAARRARSRVGACRAVAFLVRRPAGKTLEGDARTGAFGFVAVDVGALLAWEPSASTRGPPTIMTSGGLFQRGVVVEPAALPTPPPPARAPPPDRWAELTELSVKRGWVTALDFCIVFNRGPQCRKKATERVLKRLRGKRKEVEDAPGAGTGRPKKMVRIGDLRAVFSEYGD